ncbi:MAG: heme oxygenase (biliverdin-producing) [Cyanobacteria bacterium P01_D01_bin.105]
MNSSLSTKLREGTKKAHTMAENVGFVRCFLKGVVEKNSYRKLVGSFYYVYSEMEDQMRKHQDHPILSQVYYPVLNRQRSLEQDLRFYYGDSWKQKIEISPATQVYLERIRQVSEEKPELLIAHSYTRYLGDLSGGQILQGIAQRALNLSEGEGTAFYTFEEIPDEKQFKVAYRSQLDALPLNEELQDLIVDEANAAFDLNMKLFQELEGNLLKAIGQVLFNTLTRRRTSGSTELAPTK